MIKIVNTCRITRHTLLVTGLVALLSMFLPAPNASALGLGIAPAQMEITDALRGTQYDRMITVFNPDPVEINVTFGQGGNIDGWAGFYQLDNPSVRVDTLLIPAKGEVKVLVRFSIPEDTASGKYTGTVYAETVPDEEDKIEAGILAKLQAPAIVTITVIGEEIISGTVHDISVMDIETSYPLRIKVDFANTGNVWATPDIQAKIKKAGDVISNLSSAGTKVAVNTRETIVLEWDSAEQEVADDYTADISVVLKDKVIATEEIPFKILPVGTISRSGTLSEFTLQGEAKLDSLVVLNATFVNTGLIDTKAKFLGEIYIDGELSRQIQSEEVLVTAATTDILKAYLKLETLGRYKISGYINYEGKKTEIRELAFDVTGEELSSQITGETAADNSESTIAQNQSSGIPFYIFIILGVIIIAIAIFLAMYYLKKNKRTEKSDSST